MVEMQDDIWDVYVSAHQECLSIGSLAWGLRLNVSRMSREVYVRLCVREGWCVQHDLGCQ